MKTLKCDVLVVGGGGAGLRAALAACATTPSVILATRGTLGRSGVTATACSDRMAFHATLPYTPPGGPWNWAHHAEDIYSIGGCVSDPTLAEILARESTSAFEYLAGIGVPWVMKEEGRADQFLTDGSRHPRACYTGPYTANHIHDALRRAFASSRCQLCEQVMVVDLLLDPSEGRVLGAVAIDETTAESIIFQAKSIVLATGGAGGTFASSAFPPGMTGDGYAMAFRAGAELVNMEFIQQGLCSTETGLACSGSLMRALPRLVDDTGQELLGELCEFGFDLLDAHRMLFEKGASWPVSYEQPSYHLDLVVWRAKRQGRRVYLDYRRNPSGFSVDAVPPEVADWHRVKGGTKDLVGSSPLERLFRINPQVIEWLRDHDVDLGSGQLLEIEPSIQHFQGGVRIHTNAETSVRGLFAAGECAGGQHGANRPGGSALLDCQVFGRIAGESAAYHSTTVRQRTPPSSVVEGLMHRLCRDRMKPKLPEDSSTHRTLRETLQRAAGIVRTSEGLETGLRSLTKLAEIPSLGAHESVLDAVEGRNMHIVATAILMSAGLRAESRGPHLRFRSETDLEAIGGDPELTGRMVAIGKDDREPSRMIAEWTAVA